MTELSNETRLLIKLYEEKVNKAIAANKGMAEVATNEVEKAVHRGTAEGMKRSLDILDKIVAEL